MAKDFAFVPFKREDHIYHNEAFAELCKDAVRAFNGTPVCELPPPAFYGIRRICHLLHCKEGHI
jgi:hypothetical protein